MGVLKRTVGRSIGGSNVLKKLISKAQKRKMVAENYHIYALLQSTIVKLQSDCDSLRIASCNRRGDKNGSFPGKGLYNEVQTCMIDSVEHGNSDDILKLDLFFRKLDGSSYGAGS